MYAVTEQICCIQTLTLITVKHLLVADTYSVALKKSPLKLAWKENSPYLYTFMY